MSDHSDDGVRAFKWGCGITLGMLFALFGIPTLIWLVCCGGLTGLFHGTGAVRQYASELKVENDAKLKALDDAKAEEAARDAERNAQALLDLAKNDRDEARRKKALRMILDQYPHTKAATEAAVLMKPPAEGDAAEQERRANDGDRNRQGDRKEGAAGAADPERVAREAAAAKAAADKAAAERAAREPTERAEREKKERERAAAAKEAREARDEDDAKTLLDLAKRTPGETQKRNALNSVITKFPKTKAAAEARELLKSLGG